MPGSTRQSVMSVDKPKIRVGLSIGLICLTFIVAAIITSVNVFKKEREKELLILDTTPDYSTTTSTTKTIGNGFQHHDMVRFFQRPATTEASWTTDDYGTLVSDAQSNISDKPLPTITPLGQTWTNDAGNEISYNGDLLINNASLNVIINEHLFNATIGHVGRTRGSLSNPSLFKPVKVVHYSKGVFIRAEFPPSKPNITRQNQEMLRTSNDFSWTSLANGSISVPIRNVFPDEAMLFLLEYFDIEINGFDEEIGFLLNSKMTFKVKFVNYNQAVI